MQYRMVKFARLNETHLQTGKTKHVRDGLSVGRPTELRIVRFDQDPGYYLLHLDGAGAELTDTYHETLEDAELQAVTEFLVRPEDWEVAKP